MTAPQFDALEFKPKGDHIGGIQALMTFPNGYTASVIKSPYSYGGQHGLYEVAVKYEGSLVYDTPVTDDVEGYLTPQGVTRVLGEIAALPPRQGAQA